MIDIKYAGRRSVVASKDERTGLTHGLLFQGFISHW